MPLLLVPLGSIIGIFFGAIVGGIFMDIIIPGANQFLAFKNLEYYVGLSPTIKLIVLLVLIASTFGGGATGGYIGYKLRTKS
jgi:hypothetical protein